MTRRVQENIVAGLILLFFVSIIVLSFNYGPRARLVPIPVATLGIILTLVQIVWQNRRPADELHIDLLSVLTKDKAGAPDVAPPPDGMPERSVAAQVRGMLIVAGFLVIFLALGPFPAIFLFVSAYLTVTRYCSFGRAVLFAAVLTLILWVIFVNVLRLQVYWGVLEPLARSLGL